MNLPAIFTGIRSRADSSFTLTFVTQELDGKMAAPLLDMQNKMCDLTIGLEGVDNDEAPVYKATNPAHPKSPSKALRDEMYGYFSQARLAGNFDEFYEKVVKEYVMYWHDMREAL